MRFLLPLLLLAGCAAAEVPASEVISVKATAVPLNPKNPAQHAVDRLRYMGGLVLRSDDKRFGGISGLRWIAYRDFSDGKSAQPVELLLAITDAGNWMVLEPREANARLVGLSKVTLGSLHGLDGRPLESKADADAEAVTLLAECGQLVADCVPDAVAISFERDHRIWRYRLGHEGGPTGLPEDPDLAHAWLKRQPLNGGVEAIAGSDPYIVLFSEELRDANGKVEGRELYCEDCDAWPDQERGFTLDLPTAFQPTDSVWSPRGPILLSRSFSPMRGVAARLDVVDIVHDAEGRPSVSGKLTPIATLRPPLSIDNMEGLAVRQVGDRTFIYIVSDDNFSSLQRTLLLKFELLPAKP